MSQDTEKVAASEPTVSLENPFSVAPEDAAEPGRYETTLKRGAELRNKPYVAAGTANRQRQHLKEGMTVWERIQFLADDTPHVLYQNWGPNLDGASLVTAIITVDGRDVAVYGHDFTVRAGSMDATNGKKLARLFELAAKRHIPLVGLNDSAGAYIPAGVGGLDGYADAFTALRKISGIVPSIMCMFGFNAGGGSYLPRQGSFLIQPKNTFFGLTGPGVVKSVLGEDITPDELGKAWDGGRLYLPLVTHLNGELYGKPDAGPEMHFSFHEIVSHICKTRSLCAGTIVGSGTISNKDRSRGSSCLAEKRMIEKIDTGEFKTPFMNYGDTVSIEMFNANGDSIFGRIEQTVERMS